METETRGTVRHAFRVSNALWTEFGRVAEPNRTAVLVAYIKKYVKTKGGTIPDEPARRPGPKPAAASE